VCCAGGKAVGKEEKTRGKSWKAATHLVVDKLLAPIECENIVSCGSDDTRPKAKI